MAVSKVFDLIVIFLILPSFIVSHTHDCYYNDKTKHVEYVCNGNLGENFDHRNKEFLYCHNYTLAINRSEIESIDLQDCLIAEFIDKRLYLEPFENLRVLNISFMGLEDLPEVQFLNNRKLERIIASHNKLTSLRSYTFDPTRELNEIDFSYNQISLINSVMFNNPTKKLKIVNFANNEIEFFWPWTFVNLLDLEVLNLNNNHIKHLGCQFLSTLTERKSLDIWINTLEEVQTTCNTYDKEISLDIVISPKASSTRLHVSDGKMQWIFPEDDFNRLQRLNFTNSVWINKLNIDQETDTLEIVNVSHYYTLDQLYSFDCVFLLIAVISCIICIYQLITRVICIKRNYKKNLSVYSIEQNLLSDNQYGKLNEPQNC